MPLPARCRGQQGVCWARLKGKARGQGRQVPALPCPGPEFQEFHEFHKFHELPEFPEFPEFPDLHEFPRFPEIPEFPKFPEFSEFPKFIGLPIVFYYFLISPNGISY